MNLEEEKKLVAKKLMGWEVKKTEHDEIFFVRKETEIPMILYPFNWETESKRKWWDEIWEKMDDDLIERYLEILGDSFGLHITDWNYHTAKPETCWKALVKTLEES